MMIRKTAIAALICAAASLALFSSCGLFDQKAKAKDSLVRVGNVTIGRESLDIFHSRIATRFPEMYPYYFPGPRMPVTFMVECEAIWQYVKSDSLRQEIKSSLDWQWKERFFGAGAFINLLGDNLGFTDAELEAYYKKHLEEFRVTVPAEEEGKQDSTFIPPFENAVRQVADRVFYNKYKPDSAFLASLTTHDHEHDETAIRNYWLYHVRTNQTNFYMTQFFLEKTGEVYESERQVYDPDGSKIIKTEDIETVRAWLPEGSRGMRVKELVEYLYTWYIFTEQAEKRGLTNTREHKDIMHWVLRVEHAMRYMRQETAPKIAAFSGDSAAHRSLAELIVFDNVGRTTDLSAGGVRSEIDVIVRAKAVAAADSLIYAIRRSVKVTWLQDEFKDERCADPAKLLARADSLREAAMSGDPESPEATDEKILDIEHMFRVIAADFMFAPEGRRAATEYSKMLIDRYGSGSRPEKYLLTSAINSYRRTQMFETDPDNLCNSYFMIGFTYDEHMKNYPLAEANYKWILRNTPNCALASDAEFMMLHLGEPMTSIEEIQGQSIRMGRVVDFDEEEPAEEGGTTS